MATLTIKIEAAKHEFHSDSPLEKHFFSVSEDEDSIMFFAKVVSFHPASTYRDLNHLRSFSSLRSFQIHSTSAFKIKLSLYGIDSAFSTGSLTLQFFECLQQ